MDQYEIVFKGEVMPNLELEKVATAMAALFKTQPEKIASLFSGEAHTLKSGLNRDAAEKYRDALKRTGAIVYLRRAGVATHPAQARTTTRNGGGLSVAPMIGDLIRPQERPRVVAVDVDTSAIELADNDGSPLAPPAPPAPDAPDTSHISVAATGADLNPDRPPAPVPPAIDTDAISLAPVDPERLVAAAPAQDHPVPDTSALQLEPAGEILKSHEKPPAPEPPPLQHDFDLYDPD
jgi:hypothetical protein